MLRKNFIHGTHGGNGSSDFIRNLNGYFGVARAQEILEEIFFKNGRGPEIIMDPRNTRRARMVNVSRKISFELYSCCLFHRSRL